MTDDIDVLLQESRRFAPDEAFRRAAHVPVGSVSRTSTLIGKS